MIFFRMLRHLLPAARAWSLTVNKALRSLVEAIGDGIQPAREFIDDVWDDIFPGTTRELAAWEREFYLPAVGLTEQQRRDRLDGAWKSQGGQDPAYIQRTLRDAGFDVYVHEWWDPADEPDAGVKTCVSPRNPLLYLRPDSAGSTILVECGEPLAECGEPSAECGNSLSPTGYPLVNRVFPTVPDYLTLCGEPFMECGEPSAECGDYSSFIEDEINYVVPTDPDKWAYFLYIGGQTFGELAIVDPKRKTEFEQLCLRICPLQLWIGVLVSYSQE